MPIYAYRCEACGHAKDVLQRISDPLLTTCPSCGAQAFQKQVTAAGFQLKGSGWYVTDFRGDGKAGKAAADKSEGSGEGEQKADAGKGDAGSGGDARTAAAGDAKNDSKSDSTSGGGKAEPGGKHSSGSPASPTSGKGAPASAPAAGSAPSPPAGKTAAAGPGTPAGGS